MKQKIRNAEKKSNKHRLKHNHSFCMSPIFFNNFFWQKCEYYILIASTYYQGVMVCCESLVFIFIY